MSRLVAAARANAVLGPLGLGAAAAASVLLARALPAAVYTDVMTVLAVVATATLLSEGGSGMTMLRYMREASRAGAAATLYRLMVRRRLLPALAAGAGVLLLGPPWVRLAGLDRAVWTLPLLAVLGLVVAAGILHVVPRYGLLGLLRHGEVALVAQAQTLARAAVVAALALAGAGLMSLAAATLAISLLATGWLARRLRRAVAGQEAPLPAALRTDSRDYGRASSLEKLTSWVGAGPVLLVLLAPFHGRAELAPLAMASDLVQKWLAVVSLPLANLVVPYLDRPAAGGAAAALGRACRLTSLVFVPAVAALLAGAPLVVPLLFGERYRPAVALVALLAVPAAAEGWARALLVPALLADGAYRLLRWLNVAEAAAALAVVAAAGALAVGAVLALVGVVKLAYAAALLAAVARRGWLAATRPPAGLLPACALAAVAGHLAGALAGRGGSPVVAAVAFALAFTATLAVACRRWLRLDGGEESILRRTAGVRVVTTLGLTARC